MNNNSGRGGVRKNAGRKKGSKTSKNTTVFYANCTPEEKKKLSDYLKQIRALIVVFVLCFFIPPASAMSAPQTEAMSFRRGMQLTETVIANNVPNDIQISVSKTKNSFQVSALQTEKNNNYYSLVLKDAAVKLSDNSVHRLIEPLSFNYIYLNKEIPNRSILYSAFPFELAPLENISYTSRLNKYPEYIKAAQIGAYAAPVNFKSKKSIIKNDNFIIQIPLLNERTKETIILEFPFGTQTL